MAFAWLRSRFTPLNYLHRKHHELWGYRKGTNATKIPLIFISQEASKPQRPRRLSAVPEGHALRIQVVSRGRSSGSLAAARDGYDSTGEQETAKETPSHRPAAAAQS